jgi:pimeloyl-ACP methyl ester carboxylesterase
MSASLTSDFHRYRLRHAIVLVFVALILVRGFGATWADDQPQRLNPRRPFPTSSIPGTSDGRPVTIRVPLEDGRFYRLNDLQRAVRDATDKSVPVDEKTDRRCEITPAERVLLLLLDGHGLKVEFASDHLTLTIPHRDRPPYEISPSNGGQHDAIWPDRTGLHVPESFDPTKRTCLLIHGFNSSSASFGPFAARCREANIQVIAFDYPSSVSILSAAQRLASDLRDLGKKYSRLRLAVVAHSRGGLVARAALELDEPRPSCVTDVFFLGTPQHGTNLAEQESPLQQLLSDAVLFAAGPRGERVLRRNSPTIADLAPNSAVVRRLERQALPAGVRYHSLIGQKGFVPKEQLPNLVREWARQVERLRLNPRDAGEAKGLLDRLSELHEGRGDGIVSIESGRLRGATTERVVSLDHIELLSQPDAAFRFMIQQMGWHTGKSGQ